MTEGTGIGPLQIQRRVANPPRDETVFSVEISPPIDTHDLFAFQTNINAVLDVMSDVTTREQLKSDLAEKRKALKVAQGQPLTARKNIERLRADRAAYLSTREAMHRHSGRRLEFKLSEKQQADLDKFDEQLAKEEREYKDFTRDIPIIEWEITCLVARINGEHEPPKPPELEAALVELSLVA